VVGDMEEDVGIVEDDPDAGVHHLLGDVLGGGGGGSDDADDVVGLLDALLKLIDMLNDDITDGTPDLLRVVVEDVVDHEPSLWEDGAARDGAPEVACADERDVVRLFET